MLRLSDTASWVYNEARLNKTLASSNRRLFCDSRKSSAGTHLDDDGDRPGLCVLNPKAVYHVKSTPIYNERMASQRFLSPI